MHAPAGVSANMACVPVPRGRHLSRHAYVRCRNDFSVGYSRVAKAEAVCGLSGNNEGGNRRHMRRSG